MDNMAVRPVGFAPQRGRPYSLGTALLLALILATSPVGRAAAPDAPVRGADELFWVPTLEQALAMAQATSRPLFLMGYSLVGDGSTYTKLGPTYCRGVF